MSKDQAVVLRPADLAALSEILRESEAALGKLRRRLAEIAEILTELRTQLN
jgi:hypothetical protein